MSGMATYQYYILVIWMQRGYGKISEIFAQCANRENQKCD